MKKLNNKGFLLVETIVVATFTLTVLIALFLQFKNLLVSYNSSYNYNTVEGIYNLNAVKSYVSQYQDSGQPLNKQLKNKNVPYLVLYNGSCNADLSLGGLIYCDELMKEGNFKTVLFSSSDPNKLKEYLKSHEDNNISEEMKNLIKRLDTVKDQNRLIAEFNDGTLATIVFGVDNVTMPAEPKPEEPTPSTTTVYRWTTDELNIGDSIEGITTTPTPPTDKSYYLKHEIDNNIIKKSYVCFITDTEHCMQGGDEGAAYETNKLLLESQKTLLPNTNNGSGCNTNVDNTCFGNNEFYHIYADVTGYIDAHHSPDNNYCCIYKGGNSVCGKWTGQSR